MITSFKVGAVFQIINEASPALRKVLADIRALNTALKSATKSANLLMDTLGKGSTRAINQARALAGSYDAVAVAAGRANREIRAANAASSTPRIPRIPNVPGGGGGPRGGYRGNSGPHYTGGGFGVPGGHLSMGRGNAAMAAGGMIAYGVYKEAMLEDEIFNMIFHAGVESSDANKKKFRDLIQKTASSTGYGYKEIAEAATDEIRLMKGADGKSDGGLSILPEMLRAAAIEARVKPGTTLKTAMESLVQMAHMAQEYDPASIKGMAPLLAFLSTTNPATMPQMVKAASYALPTLHSGLNVKPEDVMYATTAIARAGATNTKSGTWVRAGLERLLPPDARLTSPKEYARRMTAGKALGLYDKNGKSTILGSDGNMDLERAYEIIGNATKNMPITERNNFMKKQFGEQGQRGISLLMAPKVREQTAELKREFPEFGNRYNTFMQDYSKQSPMQKARQTWEDLSNVLADIGTTVLPPLNSALHDFDDALKTIKGILPQGKGGKDDFWTKVGGGAALGAGAGAGAGLLFGGIGAVPGAAIGGAIGGTLEAGKMFLDLSKATDSTKDSASQAVPFLERLSRAISALGAAASGAGMVPQNFVPSAPAAGGLEKHSDIYLDGDKVGKSVMRRMASAANRPLAGSSYHDGTMGVSPLDGVWSTTG